MSFLSADGKVYKFITRLWDIIKLSVLWLIFSLPIVTLGGASVALAKVCLQMAREEEGYVARDFVKAFKENFKEGILPGLFALVVLYGAYLDFQFASLASDNLWVFVVMGIILCFAFIMIFTYAFPLMARYENTLMGTIRTSKQIATKYFMRTLGIWLLIAFLLAFFAWNYTTILIGVLIGPASIMLLICSFASKFFREIEEENGVA